MSSSNVLLTGATGGTGAVILEQLLRAGHSVNAVLRSFAKSKLALSTQYAEAVARGKLRFTEIPDMAVEKAFHEAAAGSSAIIHAATPIAYSNFEEDCIEPAWAHLDNVLAAAAASASVKRVVITGSIVSVMRLPEDLMSGRTFSEKDFNPIKREEADSVLAAYQYSKVSSEQRAWAWMDKQKPSFDLVYLLAPAIIGKSIQVGFKPDKTAIGGTGAVYRELFDREEPGTLFPYYMDVEDVAAIHVKALDSSVPGNERYLLLGPGIVSAAAAANKIREVMPVLRQRVPAAIETLSSSQMKLAQLETSKFASAFGTQWRDWEGGILAVAEDVLKHEDPEQTEKRADTNYEIGA